MKKFLAFTAVLYAVIVVVSGLSVQQLEFPNNSTKNPPVSADELVPFYSEDDTRSWNFVDSFSGAYQMDQPTITPSFYIPGDIFRVTYNIDNEYEDDSFVPTGNPFFYIEAMHQTDNEDLLAGRVENPYAIEKTGGFEVDSGNSAFYLYIWSVNCVQWEVTVESLY